MLFEFPYNICTIQFTQNSSINTYFWKDVAYRCVFLFEKLLSMPIFIVFPFEITTRNNRNETKLTPIVSIVDIKILIPPIHQVEFYCFIYTNDKSKNCINLKLGKGGGQITYLLWKEELFPASPLLYLIVIFFFL